MVLTEEQKERIRKNRERALAIQKKRREELQAAAAKNGDQDIVTKEGSSNYEVGPPRKKVALEWKRKHGGIDEEVVVGEAEANNERLELEEFEVGASNFVTKKEAMKMYLLPEGTLAVCKYVEKPNPQNKKFQPMKLYDRAEVRRLSRERFGGLQKVIEERRRRQEKRFQKDLEETRNIFK